MRRIIITAALGLLAGILIAGIPILYVWFKNDGPAKRQEAIRLQKESGPGGEPKKPKTQEESN